MVGFSDAEAAPLTSITVRACPLQNCPRPAVFGLLVRQLPNILGQLRRVGIPLISHARFVCCMLSLELTGCQPNIFLDMHHTKRACGMGGVPTRRSCPSTFGNCRTSRPRTACLGQFWSGQALTVIMAGERCNLCIAEVYGILHAEKDMVLNKRSELVSTCRHQKKFTLAVSAVT